MKVSIVILTKNAELTLNGCLETIFNQKHNFGLEVIIIDSGSTDKTIDIAKKYAVKIKNIKPSEFNHGLTRNYGISISKGEFVVLIVQDAIPSNKYWLSNIIKEFKDKKTAGVYCRQVPHDNCNPLYAIQLKEGFSSSKIRKVKSIKNIDDYYKLSPMEKYKLISFDDVCSCIRKSIWKKIPLNKTDFGEDLYWSKKVLTTGYKIVYTPDAAVIHSHNRSFIYEYKRDRICHLVLYDLFKLNTVPQIKLKDLFIIIINTWKMLWKNNYRLKYLKYYFISPANRIAGYLGQYSGARFAKKNQ